MLPVVTSTHYSSDVPSIGEGLAKFGDGSQFKSNSPNLQPFVEKIQSADTPDSALVSIKDLTQHPVKLGQYGKRWPLLCICTFLACLLIHEDNNLEAWPLALINNVACCTHYVLKLYCNFF